MALSQHGRSRSRNSCRGARSITRSHCLSCRWKVRWAGARDRRERSALDRSADLGTRGPIPSEPGSIAATAGASWSFGSILAAGMLALWSQAHRPRDAFRRLGRSWCRDGCHPLRSGFRGGHTRFSPELSHQNHANYSGGRFCQYGFHPANSRPHRMVSVGAVHCSCWPCSIWRSACRSTF